MIKHYISFLVLLGLVSSACPAQALPRSLKAYLDRNYRGWELAGECYEKESENKRILAGDFDGNGRRDYAVKFVRKGKRFFMAFLARSRTWKPFYLHIWDDPAYAKYSDLMLWTKGESTQQTGEPIPRLRNDSPADFRCESDVGGIHAYRDGMFIAY